MVSSEDPWGTPPVEPGPESRRFECPRCKAIGQHSRLELFYWDGDGNTQPLLDNVAVTTYRAFEASTVPVRWGATLCGACDQVSIWRGSQLVFPRESPIAAPRSEMPEAAAVLYEEARQVFPVSRRAAAALARAALEALLREAYPMPGNPRLDERIANLSSRVSVALWRTLTVLRTVGNDALHTDGSGGVVALLLSDEADTLTEHIFRSVNELVDELITRPREAEELYAQLSPTVRDAAEAKAKRAGND